MVFVIESNSVTCQIWHCMLLLLRPIIRFCQCRSHMVTGYIVRTATIAQGGRDLTADLGGQGTTAIQPTPGRGINRGCQLTLQGESGWRLARIRLGYSGEERLGV